jgi:hypothetical protein
LRVTFNLADTIRPHTGCIEVTIISHYAKLLRGGGAMSRAERQKLALLIETQERFLIERTAALQRIGQTLNVPAGTDLVIRLPVMVRDRVALDMRWVSVADALPEEREQPYQVIVTCTKQHEAGSMYEGKGQRRFLQDWVVRRWAKNFTHWMEAMPWPQG